MLKVMGIIVLVVAVCAVAMLVGASILIYRIEQKGHDGL